MSIKTFRILHMYFFIYSHLSKDKVAYNNIALKRKMKKTIEFFPVLVTVIDVRTKPSKSM